MCRYRHSDDFSLRFFSTPSDHSEVKMLEWKVFRSGFPADQKFLSEEISASRKTERKKVIFSSRAEWLTDNFWAYLVAASPKKVLIISHT